MIIQAFPCGPFQTNAYIIACPVTHQAAFVDPSPNSFFSLTQAIEQNQLKPKAILLTHSHWDHIADVVAVKEKYKIPVAIHPLDAPNLEKPGADLLPCWIDIEGVTPDHHLEEDDCISIGNLKFTVIHTPGHSPGSICLYCAEENTLISGDTLFKGSIGNLSFPTSLPDAMWPSLEKLAKLPGNTKVFPGHGSATTIAAEKWLKNAKNFFGY